MKKIYDNMLLQGWMFDCLELMDIKEQDKYIVCLVRTGLSGKVVKGDEKWNRLLAKALSSIKETKAKYYDKKKKDGTKGAAFGKFGGRPRKGESPEEYVMRKKGDCEWTQAFKEIKQDQELIEKIKTNSVSTETIEELSKEYSKDTVIDVMRWIKEKN